MAMHFAVSRERSNWIRGGPPPVPRRRSRRRAPSRQQSLHGTADCKNVLTVNKCSVEQEELVVVSFASVSSATPPGSPPAHFKATEAQKRHQQPPRALGRPKGSLRAPQVAMSSKRRAVCVGASLLFRRSLCLSNAVIFGPTEKRRKMRLQLIPKNTRVKFGGRASSIARIRLRTQNGDFLKTGV